MDKALEIRRQAVHLLLGIILAALILLGLINAWSLGFVIILTFLVFYVSRSKRIKLLDWILNNFERKEVRAKFPGKGMLFYLIGAEICLVFFSKDIAVASILILAFGDSIPNIVGMYFTRIKHPFSDKKFLEGAVAGLVAAFLAASIFIAWHEALIASFVAILLEGIDMKIGLAKIDDNVIVPVSAGIVVWLLRLL